MIGLSAQQVTLAPYHPAWPRLYAEEAARIATAIGHWVVQIEHIGSTSVPGLAAKPIIDIGVAVVNFEEATRCIQPLLALGYTYRGEHGIPRRHFFIKNEGALRTHHLHMLEPTNPDWRQHIAFRDYLRQRPDVVGEYATLKQQLAAQFPNDRRLYTEAKSGFITRSLRKALPALWPQVGDTVTVTVFKADQQPYRWWTTTVAAINDDYLVTVSPPGQPVRDLRKGDWVTSGAMRTYYWYDRPYSLLEVYHPTGEFGELYINIGSPPVVKGNELHFTDYELDVVRQPGQAPLLADEDEFTAATLHYGYSSEFQQWCHQVAQAALRLAEAWRPGPYPIVLP
jgi:GrpB-like predicted nucleotidyltransferase (UPF0157 family)/protein associated with RNAse G/E